MTQPDPLTPVDCDLQDFPFMPLDVARLRDSELASNETPEACWAAVLLWSASWHQVPAASIPDDDLWIAKQAGYQLRGKIDKAWSRVRAGALRGWVKCNDGRLYHPVVAEKARDAWQAKLEQRWRTECARIKKHNDRHEGANVPRPTFDEWMAAGCPTGQPLFVPRDIPDRPKGQGATVPRETHSKGQGEGQGQGQGQGNLNSVADATDGGAPPAGPPAGATASQKRRTQPKTPEDMAKAELWRAAVSVLEQGGCPDEAQARTFMGKLVRDYTFPVVQQAVAAAVTEQPAEAREYLKAACQRAAGQRQPINRQEALEHRNRNVAHDWAAQGADHATV
ncbi:DUF1376 domain-containing protein [Pulveribacter sp.]|uniref:DUF1376 domain-containing protein n=1 Tax=Pulveribacter sp. TaxID=2678893 RepID=UPI0028ACA11C|nr:DUF1376 domain-containing protein [Pulveribacter sp.]